MRLTQPCLIERVKSGCVCMPEQQVDWVFISWVKSHGRSRGIAEAVGARTEFVFPNAPSLLLRYLRSAILTWRSLSSRRPNVVFVMSPPSFAAFVVLAHARVRGQCRVIVDLHTGAVVDRKWRWSVRWIRRMMGPTDGFLVTSDELGTAAGVLSRNTFVIHDIIEVAQDNGGIAEPGPRSDTTAIVPLSYSPDEPIDQILGAAALSPRIVWQLTGTAPAAVVTRAPSNVVFTGFLDDEAYESALGRAGAVVALTTRPLTMQRAGYEALSRGKALVTSRSPVLERYFGPASGYTHCVADEIAAATSAVLEDVDGFERHMAERRDARLREQSVCLERVISFCNGFTTDLARDANDADAAAIADLRQESLHVLREVLGEATEVALIDLPTHMNVGDSLIWEGEIEYLRMLGVSVEYSSDIARFDPALLAELVPTGPILLHGGGNFGDTWPQYQDFRLDIARQFPDRKVIQLPQSIYFSDARTSNETLEVLARHRDYTLLIRDEPSMKRASELLDGIDARFCPDMAFGWNASAVRRPPEHVLSSGPIVVVARGDRERSVDSLAEVVRGVVGQSVVRDFDWGLRGAAKVERYCYRLPGRLARSSQSLRRSRLYYRAVLRPAYAGIRRQNIAAGIAIVGSAKILVTDRLHAHVMASMLGVRNIALDNHYGKVSAVFATSSSHLSAGSFASDVDELKGLMTVQLTVASNEGD